MSGSRKLEETFTVASEPPRVRVWLEIEPTANGARLARVDASTVTAIVCIAVNVLSLAVTVTVALPALSGVIVTTAPDTLTVATLVLSEVAV